MAFRSSSTRSAKRPGSIVPILSWSEVGRAAFAVARRRAWWELSAGMSILGCRCNLAANRISWTISSSSLIDVLSVPRATFIPFSSMAFTGAMPFFRRRLELGL